MSQPAKYSIDIGFALIDLYEDYLVATINEGVVLDLPQFEKLHGIFESHYYQRPFGYISNRKYDYTVNPTGYRLAKVQVNNLVGLATLCYSEACKENVTFEAQFFDFPHDVFFSMEECVEFVTEQVAKRKKAGL